jgi:predicted RNase H-like nuclease (RuvC/YqgF family)
VLEQREKGKETASMRREIRELQGSVLDAHEKATLLEEQSNKLKEEIRRLERNIRREGANLEYLKNVLVKFMCKEIGQDQMLLAIATMLQFSPGELNDVKQKISAQSRTWWAGKRT